MKKTIAKITTLTMVSSFLLGGVVMATSQHYFDEINTHKESKKEVLSQKYDEKMEETESLLFRDTNGFVNEEKERIDAEVNVYLNEKTKQYHNQKLEENKKDVKAEADKAIVELKQYIDDLFEGDANRNFDDPKG